jgi:hypothetical protein
MRKLKFQDVGKASKIIKKLNLRVDKEMAANTDAETMGASLMLKLAENFSNVAEEVAEFMTGLLEDEGMTKDEYLNRDLSDVIEDFQRLKEDEGFAAFFTTVEKLTTQNN